VIQQNNPGFSFPRKHVSSEAAGLLKTPGFFRCITVVDDTATRIGGAEVDHQPTDNQLSDDARVESLPPLRAEFGVTALAGQVLRLNGRPLDGVTLRIAEMTTRTDATGRFLLIAISPGHHELLIDGRTVSRPGQTFGVFEVGIDARAGRTNVLPFTIWMPEIDTANTVSIPSPTPDEVVVTTPNIPGWELHLPPGTIIRDKDGQAVTQIAITPVPVDRPPFPLPFGAEFPM
jgi:hypothetical protein